MQCIYAGWCSMPSCQNRHPIPEGPKNQHLGLAWKQPDLNPIENLWTILKNKVSEGQPNNAKMLEQAIKEVWVRDISLAYCRNLVESMPRRLEAVIKAKGGPTKY